jgi:hypothetical protein
MQSSITDLNEEQAAIKAYCEERLTSVLNRPVTIEILPAPERKGLYPQWVSRDATQEPVQKIISGG